MINSGLLSYLRRAAFVLFLLLCLASPGYAVDVTLQWDKSIDDAYITHYRVYYYTVSHIKGSTDYLANVSDTCASVSGDCENVQGSFKISKINTGITLKGLGNKVYYFAVSSIDNRGLEGVPCDEVPYPLVRLSVVKQGTGRGVLSADPPGINSAIYCGTGCSSDVADYARGAKVTLTATPDSGYGLVGWIGNCTVNGLNCEVKKIDGPETVTAKFAKRGDVNQDDVVNLADAVLIHKVMSRTETQPFPGDYTAMNNDGKLGLADAIYILQKIAGLRY